MTAAAALFAVRLAVIAATWHQSGRLYAELRPSFDAVPPGSCIAVAYDQASIAVQKAPLTHYATLAVARRDAFVTTLFAFPTQQPVTLQPEAQSLADLLSPEGLWDAYVTASAPLPAASATALTRCGYVTFAGTKPFTLRNSAGLAPLFVTSRFQLYRVLPATVPPT